MYFSTQLENVYNAHENLMWMRANFRLPSENFRQKQSAAHKWKWLY